MGDTLPDSREETGQEPEHNETRKRLHELFDRWLDQVEGELPEGAPTLEGVTQVIWERRHELTGLIAETLIEQAYAEATEQKTLPCPHCGRRLQARGSFPRRVETMIGAVSVRRPYFYCVVCGQGFWPLDETLQLAARRKQWDLQKAGVGLAVEMPYATASARFQELTGLSLSDHSLHEIVGAVGQGLTVLQVSPTAEEIQARVKQVGAGKKWRPILVLALDGADVPTRPETAKGKRRGRKKERAHRARWEGQWREAKGFRFYLVDGERIVHLLSWHQVQSEAEVGEALRQVQAAGLIPEAQVRLCGIADGAGWIWKHVQALFPTAVQVLDYYHCSEHLYQVAGAQWGDQPEQQREWIEATLTRLFCGDVAAVLQDLQGLTARDAPAGEQIRKLTGYLTQHQERVDYGFVRKGGYPLGSGGIESANKAICHVRLKRSGAWWYVEKANGMLALRCARYNGTFDRVFEAYKQNALRESGQDQSVKTS
jgi:hypothetical protein